VSVITVSVSAVAGFLSDAAAMIRYTIKDALYFRSGYDCFLPRGEGSASCTGRSFPPGKTRYPLYRRLGGPEDRSGQARKISPPTGIRSPDRRVRSQSLYRLS